MTIDCTIYDATDVYWIHDGVRINTNDYETFNGGTTTQPSLTILKLSRKNRGVYKCGSSYNTVSVTSKEISVQVFGNYSDIVFPFQDFYQV